MKKLVYVIFILILSVNILHASDSGSIDKYEVPPYNYVRAKYKGPLTNQQIISAIEESIDYFHKWDKYTQLKFKKAKQKYCNIKYVQKCYYYSYSLFDGLVEYTIDKDVLNYKTFQEAYRTRIKELIFAYADYEMPEKLPDLPATINLNESSDIIIVKKGDIYVFAITVDNQVDISFYINKRSDGYIEILATDHLIEISSSDAMKIGPTGLKYRVNPHVYINYRMPDLDLSNKYMLSVSTCKKYFESAAGNNAYLNNAYEEFREQVECMLNPEPYRIRQK